MAGCYGRARSGSAAAGEPLEELAAVAHRIWRGPSEQLSIDGRFLIRRVELHATALPGAAGTGFIVEALSRADASVPCVPADWLVVDRRLCGWLSVAANSLGNRTAVLFALYAVPVAISYRIPIEILLASFSVTGNLRGASRIADLGTAASLSADRRPKPYAPDDSNVERWTLALVEFSAMELELGTQFTGVVSSIRCMESEKQFSGFGAAS